MNYNNIRYIPLEKNIQSRSYIFQVELMRKGNDTWVACIESLPGCAAWGYTRDETLEGLKRAAYVYISTLVAKGFSLPTNVETLDTPVIAVTL